MNQKAFFIRSGMDGITSHFYEKSIGIFGRSVYDIHIGDLLIYQGMQYLVISFMAYRRELKKIGDGMTCELEVIGKHQEFQTDTMMYTEFSTIGIGKKQCIFCV